MRRFRKWLADAYSQHPRLDTVTLSQARQIAERVRAPLTQGGPRMMRTHEIRIDTPHGALRLRILTPTTALLQPALVYLHGGGRAFFSIDTHDRLMREFAVRTGRVVIGVDYGLAPEARYPAALEQVTAAWRWTRANAPAAGVDPNRIAPAGDSAGGNLALAAAIVLRDAGERPEALLLNYGVFCDDDATESFTLFDGTAYNLTRAEMRAFWNNYLGTGSRPDDRLATPLYATLAGLPRCCPVVPECDVLRDNSLALVTRLQEAGGPVSVQRHAGALHRFLEAVSFSDIAERGLEQSSAWLRGVWAGTCIAQFDNGIQ